MNTSSIENKPLKKNSCVACLLPSTAVIHITGDDAKDFLQNMLTNDINELSSHTMQLTGLCNPKGQLLALFNLIQINNDYYLLLPKELAETITKRLSMFVLRSQVIIRLTDDYQVVGLQYADNLLNLKLTSNTSHECEYGLLLPQGDDRHLLFMSTTSTHAFMNMATKAVELGSEAYWSLLNIRAGLPMVFQKSSEKLTPQQINLDLIDGVSFKKGCYPGQEVVARMHYLGSPSRRLFLAKLDTTDIPEVASPVKNEKDDTVGLVVQACLDETGQTLCQLALRVASTNDNLSVNDATISHISAFIEES